MSSSAAECSSTIMLFDVDGTLTLARQQISPETKAFLKGLKAQKIPLAVVGGSDYAKLGPEEADVLSTFDYTFTENGLVSFKGSEPLPVESINKALGEEKLQEVINFCLHYISTVRLPVKRGTFIEFRKGMLNVSPIGRSCSQAERDQFVEYEKTVEPVRAKFVKELQSRFPEAGLTFSIGGQISIDIFPNGWDKTHCLQYLRPHYKTIHFFGDKTEKGGNDHEIFVHPDTIGHSVTSPEHTLQLLTEIVKGL